MLYLLYSYRTKICEESPADLGEAKLQNLFLVHRT